MNTHAPLSIYIHWPYCKSKCPYCDFSKTVKKDVNQKEIINGYIEELKFYHDLVPEHNIRSVFFGGGTPSLIEPQYIELLLNEIANLWSFENLPEISLEANPNSEYPDMFKQLRKAGINRLSLGVQALNDADLKFLGRTHNLNQALHSIDEVTKNFNNHSIDLIYARPSQTLTKWEKELQQATSFGLKHLSLYQLTIEEGTVFAKKGIKSLDDEQASKMYQYTVDYLRDNGYPRYEVSNFASKTYQSRHNKCYWLGDDYIGIGTSAHGRLKIGNKHYAFVHPHLQEELSDNERAEELLLMGLRLEEGINKQHFYNICGLELDNFINVEALQQLSQLGFIENTPTSLKATDQGFLVLDYIISKLCP